jgi:UDP-glucose 4-epimerase
MGMEVVVADDLSGGFVDNIPLGAKFVRADVSEEGVAAKLWELGPYNYVYHLAAYAAEGLSHFIRRYNYTNNLIGSVSLLNQAVTSGVERFVFTSSIAVYGKNQLPMHEQLVPQPEDPYGIAKYAFELDLKAAHEMFGLNYVIFRPHNVYGERQNIADKYRNVIGIFMNQVMKKEPMTIFGDGSQKRAFSHINDVAPLIARSVLVNEATNEVFNVGADIPYTVRELATKVAEAFNAEPRINYLPARNEVVDAFATHEKARRVFRTKEAIQLKDGIRLMANWVRSNGPRQSVKFNRIEVLKNLPESWR